jgi:alanine dehydrogenase
MRIGVPKEIKNHEYRVGLTPPSVAELVAAGHQVEVETAAGAGIDFDDEDYRRAGASIVGTPAEVFAGSDMIVKVKEPQPSEIALLESRHLLFTYLHLAADKPQAEGLMKSGATCIAYETVTSRSGALPLLKPMSEVAGRMSIQVGAHYLEKEQGGRGVLLGGVPGVAPARVAILGGGVAGVNAAQMAVGMRADVTIYASAWPSSTCSSAARSRRPMRAEPPSLPRWPEPIWSSGPCWCPGRPRPSSSLGRC